MRVDTSELAQFEASLNRAAQDLPRRIEPVLDAAGKRMADAQREDAPYRTGNVRDSIGYDTYHDGTEFSVVAGVGMEPTDRDPWYAIFAERRQPFVFDKLDGETPRVMAELERAVTDW